MKFLIALNKPMINNNWIEEAKNEFKKVRCIDGQEAEALIDNPAVVISNWWIEFTKNLLTKKDQEHKAELEMIRGEIENVEWFAEKAFDVKKNNLAILDSHINKQTL